ncbi:lysylphosphatidylglycerol synthase transmembrane domain-containing protein [Saccharopolyspora griseoalba]|uniref:Lysylphosphatidylglycerol synthase transmembrane domain-containing protein n=1 Tax=Saccharopolyspora griseoalba TaxID=1431848 RepID=A0ABW2LM73_9PSEU
MRGRAWVGGALAAAVLVLLAERLGTRAVLSGLRSLDPGAIIAALALGAVAALATATRWRLVARALGAPVPMPAALADVYRAQLVNSVLPAGLVGDAHRAIAHGLPGSGGRAGFRAVVVERVGGQAVVVLAALLLIAGSAGAVGIGFALVVAALAAGALSRGRAGAGRRARPGARGWCADARTALLSRACGPGVVLLSLLALTCHLGMFVLAARVAGAEAPLGQLLPLLTAGLLAMSIPLNIGGWGPREGVTAAAFGAAGLDPAAGFAAAVLFGVLGLVSCLPGALALGRSWDGNRTRSRRRGRHDDHQPARG